MTEFTGFVCEQCGHKGLFDEGVVRIGNGGMRGTNFPIAYVKGYNIYLKNTGCDFDYNYIYFCSVDCLLKWIETYIKPTEDKFKM